jgi:hypothetical protein
VVEEFYSFSGLSIKIRIGICIGMQRSEISDSEELQELVRIAVDEVMEDLDRRIEQVVEEKQGQLIEKVVRKHLNEQIQIQTQKPIHRKYRGR